MSTSTQLPERVLQFGTGILLRGLPDYFIDKANRAGVFSGQIVVVKSTAGGVDEWKSGNGRYVVCVRGTDQGKKVDENMEINSISRVLSARSHWQDVLAVASTPELQLIVSNTTEVGLQYVPESVLASPPQSFPAKLTAVLYQRFTSLGNSAGDLIVVPTELLPDNGTLLKQLVVDLADHNNLGTGFRQWLDRTVVFCNSLVDRIVTRASREVVQAFPDANDLTIQTEPYKLWAIEGGERVQRILTFAKVDSSVIIAPDISPYRERKLRILNGAGTMFASLGFLRGIDSVYEAMSDPVVGKYIHDVVMDEIEPTLPESTRQDTRRFAAEVLERWRNEFTVHHLINITLQGSAKMKMRNGPTFVRYVEQFGKVPDLLAQGFAAHLLFMKITGQGPDGYFGTRQGKPYTVRDDAAPYFMEAWNATDVSEAGSIGALVAKVSSDAKLWGVDLSQLPMFVDIVTRHLLSHPTLQR